MAHQITINGILRPYMTQIINSMSKVITQDPDLSDYSVHVGDQYVLRFSDRYPVTINFDTIPKNLVFTYTIPGYESFIDILTEVKQTYPDCHSEFHAITGYPYYDTSKGGFDSGDEDDYLYIFPIPEGTVVHRLHHTIDHQGDHCTDACRGRSGCLW